MSNLKQAAHNSTIYLLKRRARILRFLILPSVNLRNAGFAAARSTAIKATLSSTLILPT